MEAAEAEQCPVILAVGQGAIRIGRLKTLAEVAKTMADETRLPVVLHLDHGASFEQAVQCIRAGFTSVMFDGSRYPLDENIRLTKLVACAAHAVGVSVEAELGAIKGVEDGVASEGSHVVKVEDVKEFVDHVKVDALAVAIGNAHGMYKTEPKLDFDLLRAIRGLDAGVPPLVLHGGSGLSDHAIRAAVSYGIRKINVATEIRLAYLRGLREASSSDNIYDSIAGAGSRVKELAQAKIRLFTEKEQS